MAKFLRNHSFATFASVVLHAALGFALFFGGRFLTSSPTAANGVVQPIEAVLVDEAAVQREIDRIEARRQAEIERQRVAEERARQQAEDARLEREREQQRLAEIERERERSEAREAARQEALRAQRAQEEAERLAREQAAEAERARLAELQRQREAEERRQAEAERQRQEEERRRAEEAERQRQEEERRRQEEEARLAAERAAEEERRRREAEEAARLQAEVDRVIAAELAAARARESGLYDEYIRNITNQIRQRWIRPPGSPPNLECVVNVTQIPSGDVTSVTIGRCNGNDAVVRSIEAAVLKASPLPRPGDPSLFQRNLVVTFRPEN